MINSLWLQPFRTSLLDRDYKPFGKRTSLRCLWHLTQEHPALWLKRPYFTLLYKWEMINSAHVSLYLELFAFTCFLKVVCSVCTKYVENSFPLHTVDFFFVCVISFWRTTIQQYFLLTLKSRMNSVIDLAFGSLWTRPFLFHLFHNNSS